MENSCAWYDPSCGLAWLRDELKAFVLWLYDWLLSGLAGLIEMIPVPDFMANVQSYSMPSGVAYFASAFEIPLGLTIVVSAYVVRFIIRRLPIVG